MLLHTSLAVLYPFLKHKRTWYPIWIKYLDPRSSNISTLKLDKFNMNMNIEIMVPVYSEAWSVTNAALEPFAFTHLHSDKSSCDGSGHKMHQPENSAHGMTWGFFPQYCRADTFHCSLLPFICSSLALSVFISLTPPHSHSRVYSPLCFPRPPSALWPLCHFQYIHTSAETSIPEHWGLI